MKLTTEAQLREIYGQPKQRTIDKVLSALDVHCINFIERSPFMVLATADANGNLDTSPKGGEPGFVHVLSPTEFAIPDSRGNNRIDSLVNLAETGKCTTIFFIPGMDETLRINGSAHITNDTALLASFPEGKNPPKTAIVITVEEAFLHCAKALMRSELWNPENHMDRSEMPSMGQMLKDQIGHTDPAETREQMLDRYKDQM